MTRKPVNTRLKSSRKFMAKEACPAVLLPTAGRAGRGGEAGRAKREGLDVAAKQLKHQANGPHRRHNPTQARPQSPI